MIVGCILQCVLEAAIAFTTFYLLYSIIRKHYARLFQAHTHTHTICSPTKIEDTEQHVYTVDIRISCPRFHAATLQLYAKQIEQRKNSIDFYWFGGGGAAAAM